MSTGKQFKERIRAEELTEQLLRIFEYERQIVMKYVISVVWTVATMVPSLRLAALQSHWEGEEEKKANEEKNRKIEKKWVS